VTDLAVLQEFYGDVLASLLRHERAAQIVTQYDANNTYQYILNRQDAHLSWLRTAIAELGGVAPDAADANRAVSGKGPAAVRAVQEEDARDAQAFVDRWRPRIEAMTNARHAMMLRVILGEVLEQKRFFEQALAGRADLLGRRGEQVGPATGEVLPTRWVE
jgi:hypothetical protein